MVFLNAIHSNVPRAFKYKYRIDMGNRSPHRDALRILYILVAGSSPPPADNPSGAVAIFKGEVRLQAFDFWMRNPDYLADELLDLFETTGNERYLSEAANIFSAEEPDIRRFPMIRYRFGAYERMDDKLSMLVCRKLIKIAGRKSGDRILENNYLLMQSAIELSERIITEFPGLAWYAERSRLVAEIAGDLGGVALKDRQYEKSDYAATHSGGVIPPIADRVKARLDVLLAGSTS